MDDQEDLLQGIVEITWRHAEVAERARDEVGVGVEHRAQLREGARRGVGAIQRGAGERFGHERGHLPCGVAAALDFMRSDGFSCAKLSHRTARRARA